MKKILILGIIVASAWACDTNQDVWNSGVCSPYFDGTIMDYLRADDYNWELTVEMIERAGLTDLFEGQVDTLPEITFWAPKSYSIARWLLDSQKAAVPGSIYTTVEDVPVELCRELILSYVVKGKYLKEDIAYQNMSYYIGDEEQDGGTYMETQTGCELRAYLLGSDWQGVADAGPVTLNLWSFIYGEISVVTPDIQPKNGVIHALDYEVLFGNI